jgi:hypothetical protein
MSAPELFLISLTEAMRNGKRKVKDPETGKSIKIGSDTFNKRFEELGLTVTENSDSSSSSDSSDSEEAPPPAIKQSEPAQSAASKIKKRGLISGGKSEYKQPEKELTLREKFINNPTINPHTGRAIKKDGPIYKKLLKEFS